MLVEQHKLSFTDHRVYSHLRWLRQQIKAAAVRFRQVIPRQWANSKRPQQWLRLEKECNLQKLVFYAIIGRAFDLHEHTYLLVSRVGVFFFFFRCFTNSRLQREPRRRSRGNGWHNYRSQFGLLSKRLFKVKTCSVSSGSHLVFPTSCKLQRLSIRRDCKRGGGKVAVGTRGLWAQAWLLTDMCY